MDKDPKPRRHETRVTRPTPTPRPRLSPGHPTSSTNTADVTGSTGPVNGQRPAAEGPTAHPSWAEEMCSRLTRGLQDTWRDLGELPEREGMRADYVGGAWTGEFPKEHTSFPI